MDDTIFVYRTMLRRRRVLSSGPVLKSAPNRKGRELNEHTSKYVGMLGLVYDRGGSNINP